MEVPREPRERQRKRQGYELRHLGGGRERVDPPPGDCLEVSGGLEALDRVSMTLPAKRPDASAGKIPIYFFYGE